MTAQVELISFTITRGNLVKNGSQYASQKLIPANESIQSLNLANIGKIETLKKSSI